MGANAIILIFLAVGVAMTIGGYFGAWLLRRDKPTPLKGIPYECGEETHGRTWIQFHPGYYIIALVFVIFDVEAVFLVPWAVAFNTLRETGFGMTAFVSMMIFIVVLLLGLVWVWKRGALEWE